MKVHIFNPENDLALANNSPFFVAPKSALKLARDLRLLPFWISETGDKLITSRSEVDLEWDRYILAPWGWSHATAFYLKQCGCDTTNLPTSEQLNNIRLLSHRSLTIDVINELKCRLPYLDVSTPIELKSDDEAMDLLSRIPDMLLKQPWSSSGKGLCWSNRYNETNLGRWINTTFKKMGSVMAERIYEKVVDFAMTFYAGEDGNVTFAGYSLFDTDISGAYKGNLMMSNDEIEQLLQAYVSTDTLRGIRDNLSMVMADRLRHSYCGYFGIDMMIYKTSDDIHHIHPCVEVNLRMTMGIMARLIYDKHIKSGHGRFQVSHSSVKGELLEIHERSKSGFPLRLEHGRIVGGYHALTPVDMDTQYCASVIIE